MRFLLSLVLIFQGVVNGPTTINGPTQIGNPGAASSTITPDLQSISTTTTSGTAVSWNHTVSAGTHQALVVKVQGSPFGGAPTATCSYNSVSMTFVTSDHDGSNGNATALFILAAPSVGTFSVSCTWGATITAVVGTAEGWFGVNQSTPNRTPIVNHPAGATAPTTVVVSNAVAGDMVIDAVTVNVGTVITVTGSQTQRNERTNVGGNNVGVGTSSVPAAGSTTMGWSYAGTHAWDEIGMALIPG